MCFSVKCSKWFVETHFPNTTPAAQCIILFPLPNEKTVVYARRFIQEVGLIVVASLDWGIVMKSSVPSLLFAPLHWSSCEAASVYILCASRIVYAPSAGGRKGRRRQSPTPSSFGQ